MASSLALLFTVFWSTSCISKGDTNVGTGPTPGETDDTSKSPVNTGGSDDTPEDATDDTPVDDSADPSDDSADPTDDSADPTDDSADPTGEPCGVKSSGSIRPVQLAGGLFHSCARMSDGTVRCWTGNNNTGQLGDGSTKASLVPKAVPDLVGIVDLAAGDFTTCTVDCAGVARCWGGGGRGQLGNGEVEDSLAPVTVDLPGPAARIFVGKSATACAILEDSRQVWCWGSNFSGGLGNGTESGSACAQAGANNCIPTPVRVQGDLKDTQFVALGGPFGCAVAGNDVVSCWGSNFYGNLGNEELSSQLVASPISTGPQYPVLVGGQSHMCGAWKVDGESRGFAWCWGSNTFGQLGRGTSDEEANDRYAKASDLDQITRMSAGKFHTCATQSSGSVFCWGRNERGQLGLGHTDGDVYLGLTFIATPTQVPGIRDVVDITAGSDHTCALDEQNNVYCWGDNVAGQIGDGTTAGEACADGNLLCRTSPTRVIGW